MTTTLGGTCLNCGAELQGRFCHACGQRVAPAFPTLREMIVDAWQELTIFDGRLARTVWLLVRHPGMLALEYLSGRRATYLPPLRLYLVASVVFFLIAALVPSMSTARRTATLPGREKVTIDLMDTTELTPAQREEAEKSIERAPAFMQPLFRRAFFDRQSLRANMVAAFPRVLFVLVPVFAAIVAIFYWRPFSQHLVFALYLHAAVFMTLAVARLANATRSVIVAGILELTAMVFLVVYSQVSFRKVYGDSWPRVLVKSLGIGVLYLFACVLGIAGAVIWSAWV